MALAVVGLLVVGGALAALVGYLSNSVTATATVESPLELRIAPAVGGSWEDSLDLGTVYGGAEVNFRLKEVNRANQAVSSNLVITVSEPGVANSCDEMTLEFRAQGNVNWHEIPCIVVANNLKFSLPTDVPAGQNQVYEVKATLAQAALGTYTATVQHMVSP